MTDTDFTWEATDTTPEQFQWLIDHLPNEDTRLIYRAEFRTTDEGPEVTLYRLAPDEHGKPYVAWVLHDGTTYKGVAARKPLTCILRKLPPLSLTLPA